MCHTGGYLLGGSQGDSANDVCFRVFHGDRDDIIPPKASQRMVAALEKADANEVKFTLYSNLMHDSWTETYNDPELYRWMLSHKRHVKGDEEVVPAENKVVLSGSE